MKMTQYFDLGQDATTASWELRSLPHQGPLVPSGYPVNDVKTQVLIKQRIAHLWKVPPKRKTTPMPDAVSLQRHHFQHLKTQPYALLEKSDGVRYLLLLTRMSDGEPKSFMVNRKQECWEVSVVALEIHFDGTLLDGELVYDSNQQVLHYLIFDLVASPKFPNISSQPLLPTRSEALNKLIFHVTEHCDDTELEYQVIQGFIFSACTAPMVHFRLKQFFPLHQCNFLH